MVVLGLAVLLVALMRGGGGEGSSGNSSVAPSSTAEARGRAGRVALAPADWGPIFTPMDPYEITPLNETTVQENCELTHRAPRTGTLASLERNVHQADPILDATSEVRVFADTATAGRFVADAKDATHRCRSETKGKARWADVHEAPSPEVDGFDEMTAEESKMISYGDGTKANDLYLILTGRAGDTVLTTTVVGNVALATEIRKHGADGLQLMQKRAAAE